MKILLKLAFEKNELLLFVCDGNYRLDNLMME